MDTTSIVGDDNGSSGIFRTNASAKTVLAILLDQEKNSPNNS